MKLTRLRNESAALADFYQEALEHLGAVCDRTWFDRLQLIAEGPAAQLWHTDGSLVETELCFATPDSSAPRDAARDVFPGCPLTFRLAEALVSNGLVLERAVLADGPRCEPPSTDVAEKLWRAQWPNERPWRLHSSFTRSHHFSLLALVRCEVQAIEQHWSLHRIALSLPGGERDDALATSLEFAEWEASPPSDMEWPARDPARFRRLVMASIEEELGDSLALIRTRQDAYLRRELERIDTYFEGYAEELTQRAARTRSDDARLKAGDRLAAAQAEHLRRRHDQIHRHEIRVFPRLDALTLIAEPAWDCSINQAARGDRDAEHVRFVPRLRKWFRQPQSPAPSANAGKS